MSNRQRDIYDFIKNYIAEKKYPPTIREIGEALEIKSTSTVHGHLDRMRKGGYINFVDSAVRTLSVVEEK